MPPAPACAPGPVGWLLTACLRRDPAARPPASLVADVLHVWCLLRHLHRRHRRQHQNRQGSHASASIPSYSHKNRHEVGSFSCNSGQSGQKSDILLSDESSIPCRVGVDAVSPWLGSEASTTDIPLASPRRSRQEQQRVRPLSGYEEYSGPLLDSLPQDDLLTVNTCQLVMNTLLSIFEYSFV
ncbi:unnamed protein product [Protopolystoma xenopodis]|uniref:Uncharacterized protein n=1 Tax=Protopolystoma xenopodis TaxID=117903 RepID=A0A448XSA6_9PLAT|nr:unnamed protein product [Protopolystoma xenopodis]